MAWLDRQANSKIGIAHSPPKPVQILSAGQASTEGGYIRVKGLETDTCPFANLPERKRTQWALTKEEMKNCVWLKPELVAQIEFTEWTPDGHLRHSKFVGLREDKEARDVVRER